MNKCTFDRMVEQCHDLEIFPLMSKSDMARRWGVATNVVVNWAARHADFPKPLFTVNDGKTMIYALCDVRQYEISRGLKL